MTTILPGHVLDRLKELPCDSVQVCVTSPPYWGLRSYLPAGHPLKHLEIGSEGTPELFVAKMVEVFAEVRRVLKPDGTLWMNLGDSYANVGKWGGSTGGKHVNGLHGESGVGREKRDYGYLKPKDIVGIPWMVAFALRSAGWYLRQDIIWSKPNPMPESVTDRCTKAHEYLFLLTKSERYYYDQEAIKEPCSLSTHARLAQNISAQSGSVRANGGEKKNGAMKAVGNKSWNGSRFDDGKNLKIHPNTSTNRKHGPHGEVKNNASFDDALQVMPEFRNKRSVWTIGSEPYSEAHFATFPKALVRPCILAGSRAGDTVLDPFGGSGTVGEVAAEYGRNCILIELNSESVELARDRTNVTQGLAL